MSLALGQAGCTNLTHLCFFLIKVELMYSVVIISAL